MYSRSVSKHQKKFFLYPNRFVYIAFEVGISCKGPINAACMFIVTSKTNIMFFKQQPVVVNFLTSVLSTSSQHRCH